MLSALNSRGGDWSRWMDAEAFDPDIFVPLRFVSVQAIKSAPGWVAALEIENNTQIDGFGVVQAFHNLRDSKDNLGW